MVDSVKDKTQVDRFNAAVKVIQGLPKDGPFQPSNELKLKFYGFYKQATEGPCKKSKPAFWDIVNRAKWDAWKCLGEMGPEEAMEGYINNIKGIVETMALDDNVQDFMSKMGPIFEFVGPDGQSVQSKPLELQSNNSDSEPEHIVIPETQNNSEMIMKIPNGDIQHYDSNSNRLNSTNSDYHGIFPTPDNVNGVQQGTVSEPTEVQSDEDIFADAEDLPQAIATNSELNETSRERPDSLIPKRTKHKRSKEPSGDNVVRFAPGLGHSCATDSVGSLLRELPMTDTIELSPSETDFDELYNASWEAVERLKNARTIRLAEDTTRDEFARRAAKMRKSRGREDGTSKHGHSTITHHSDSVQQAATSDPDAQVESNPSHQSSGSELSESSSGGRSPDISWDPHVAAVMFRTHRELQQISRQLDLMEGILITQQRLIHATLNQTMMANRSRLLFFTNLPWRTIAFIIVWPFFVHFLIRLFWRRLILRRRR